MINVKCFNLRKHKEMKKILSTATALSFALSAASAMAEPEFFVGAGLGNSKLSYKMTDSYFDDTETGSESETLLYIRAGANYENGVRAYGTLSTVGYDDNVDQLTVSASVDKLFPMNDEMSFYVGGTAGYTSFDFDDIDSESGLLLGAQGGVFYQATPKVGIDVGVSYSITTAEIKESETFAGTTYEYKLELKDVTVFRLGVDYKF